ncbi:MAG: glycosyltransferase family 39 protein [Bacteroidota bacterium]
MNNFVRISLLLASATFIIIFSGIWVGNSKVFWSGDETISYLCATGNQENFNSVAAQTLEEAVNTTTWTNLLSINEPYCFQRIANELSLSDLHPPLYFWLLHVYLLKFGYSLSAGVLLNIVLHLLSLVALFSLTRKLSFTPVAAATICILWALSPAALSVDFYARQYALLGLIHLVYAGSFLSWMQQPTKTNILLLVVCSTLGFLTHYSFVYTAGGYFMFALFHYKKIGLSHIVALATTYIVAGLLLSLLHPHFAHQFQLQQQRAQSFEAIKLIARAGKTVLTFCNFFVPVLLLKQLLVSIPSKLLLVLAGLSSAALALCGWMMRNRIRNLLLFIRSYTLQTISFPAFIACWISLVTIIPYLLFITPFHSMGAQYLVCLYPFMAILLFKLIGQSQPQIIIFCVVLLGGSCLSAYMFSAKQTSFIPLREQVREAGYIVCDKGDRRNIGRIIPYLQQDKTILINAQLNVQTIDTVTTPALILISTYEKPNAALTADQQYYDFEDWGGFVVVQGSGNAAN